VQFFDLMFKFLWCEWASLLFSTTNIPWKTPPTWPSSTTPPPTPPFIVMASPLPYSRMIFEATCGTISELGLLKLSSEFSTLASPYASQSTSLEDYLKGVASARPYSEYLSLILITNSQPNFPCGDSPWTPTAKPTQPPTRIYNAHLD